MSDNPNPRGWVGRYLQFIDLERVVCMRGSLVHFDSHRDPVQFNLDDEDRASLAKALAFYRSSR